MPRHKFSPPSANGQTSAYRLGDYTTMYVENFQKGDRFVIPEEAAKILGTTVNTLNYQRATGRGPRYFKQNRAVRYLLSDLIAYGTRNPVEPGQQRISA